jgi:hypothetical protein
VIRQILAIGENLKHGIRSINEIVVFDEEEITEEILQNRVKDVTRRIDELQKHYKRASLLAGRFSDDPGKRKSTRMPPLPMQRPTMHDHANALPSPSRFQYAKADFHAFVAERCEMISSLASRLCDGEPRKAEDGPTWSASAN